MIVYKMQDGVCMEVRFVPDDYKPAQDEALAEGDALPSRESLSDPTAWAAYTAPPPLSLSDGQLSVLLVQQKILSQATIDAALIASTAPLSNAEQPSIPTP